MRSSTRTWVVAGAVSLVLFGLVVAHLDRDSLARLSDGISPSLAGAGVVLFVVESLFSALRMYLIAGKRGGFSVATRVTAWHAIWLIVLPLRLGEVAWVVVMQRAYGWNTATAVACAAVQRLLDLAVVAAFLLLTIPATFGLHEDRLPAFSALAVAVCLLAIIVSATLHVQLRLLARLLVVGARRPRGRRRRFLRHLNQARRWLEDVRHRRAMRRCIVPTVIIWTAVIAGYWILGQAVGLDLALAEFCFAAAGSNIVAAFPVPSVGGFGLLEAGFTGIVAWFGAPVGTAVLAALAIRLASMAAAVLFWLIATAWAGAARA